MDLLYGGAAKQCLETHLFYDLRLSAAANQVSACKEAGMLTRLLRDFTMAKLGHPFGLSQIRHIIAALARKAQVIHQHDHSAEQEEHEETYDRQAGHSTRTSDLAYARCGDDHSRVGDFFRRWSLIYHHHILGLKETPQTDTIYSLLRLPAQHEADPAPSPLAPDDYHKLRDDNKKLHTAMDGLREEVAKLSHILSAVLQGHDINYHSVDQPEFNRHQSPLPDKYGHRQREASDQPPDSTPSHITAAQRGLEPSLITPPNSWGAPAVLKPSFDKPDHYPPSGGVVSRRPQRESRFKGDGTTDDLLLVEEAGSDDDDNAGLLSPVYWPLRPRSRSFGGPISETSDVDDTRDDADPSPQQHLIPPTATTKRLRSPSPIIPSKRRLVSPLPPSRMTVPVVSRASAAGNVESFGAVLTNDIRALRAFRKDPAAMFRSMDQYAVYRNILERTCHTVHVTRTGGGKTLPLQLAMKQWPVSVKAVVIMPYVILYGELKGRFDDVGLPAQICPNSIALDPTKRVYILGINAFSMNDTYSQVCHLAQQGNLGAVFIDEADGVVADSWRGHYEWAYKCALQLPKTVLIFASATIPQLHEQRWLEKLGIEDVVYPRSSANAEKGPRTPIQVVRHRATDRINIRYETRAYVF